MLPDETALGGPDRGWRTTIWSQILAAGDPSHPGHREHLDRLLRTYWKPVYAYVRRAWHKPVEDAKDLTQSFFAVLLEKQTWARIQPDKGSFRAYLRTALRHFLVNAKEFDDVRRGVKPTVSIEASPDELERLGAGGDADVDRAFDREWFQILMDGAVAQLRETLGREGKTKYIDVFERYCRGAAEPTYAEVARELGLKESDVRNHLSFCRRVLRGILHDRVREYVSSEEDVERELREAAGG